MLYVQVYRRRYRFETKDTFVGSRGKGIAGCRARVEPTGFGANGRNERRYTNVRIISIINILGKSQCGNTASNTAGRP